MTPRFPVLVVTMGTDYVAPARMPRELARAGFAVTVLAQKDALATRTVHAEAIVRFPERASIYEWMHAVASAAPARWTRGCGCRTVRRRSGSWAGDA